MQERTLACPECGVEFTTKWIKQLFCTRKCGQDFHNAINNAKRKTAHQERSCAVCEKPYTPIRSDSATCSQKCRTRHNNRRRKGYEGRECRRCGATFRPANKATQEYCTKRCWYDRNLGLLQSKPLKNQPRYCGDCGIALSERGPQAKYCKVCIKERNRLAAYNRRALSTECSSCGIKFPKPRRSTVCSRSCAVRSANAKREWRRTCIACGEEFLTHDRRPQTCGNSCRQWARNFPGVPRIRIGTCEYCQQPFSAHRGDQRFCDKACNRRKRQELERAAKNGVAFVESVTRKYIAERDKWICQLCGEKVNKRLKYPHPMCASVDHVIPLTRGGEHSRANTQLAHLLCNCRKSNRLKQPQQLALIG